MTAGIDIVGRVTASTDAEVAIGDLVTVNGWGVGTDSDGGFAERARVDPAWVTPVPKGLDGFSAAAIGTAGYAAALAVLALQDHYVTPASGPVLVTGAAGGAGSVAIALLAALGYHVVASTGRSEEHAYLRGLGANEIVERSALSETPDGPVGPEQWAGAIDTVGSNTLANILATTKYGGTVAAFGLVQGIDLPVTVLPFITRGVTLAGIDSVNAPTHRRARAWQLLADALEPSAITSMTRTIPLREAIQTSLDTLSGKVRGRVVVDVNA